MRARPPIVDTSTERTLVDRRTLAYMTQRPVSTIRARCEVVSYHPDGRALYDHDAARAVLAVTPPRGHSYVPLAT